MTYDELTEVAKKQGLVRWEASGIIEYLRLTTKDVMLARRFKESLTHQIQRRSMIADAIDKRTPGGLSPEEKQRLAEDVYHCVEITREEALAFRAAARAAAPGDAA